jgi:ligand-binding SRPBCC domain-containing protein
MRKIFVRCRVHSTFQKVVDGFNRQLLESLSPDLMQLRILRYDGQKTGDCFTMQMGPPLLNIRWEGRVTAAGQTPATFWFEDEGLKLPFPLKAWRHRHVVRKAGDEAVIMDIVSYTTGNRILDILCFPFLKAMFRGRIKKYQRYFLS